MKLSKEQLTEYLKLNKELLEDRVQTLQQTIDDVDNVYVFIRDCDEHAFGCFCVMKSLIEGRYSLDEAKGADDFDAWNHQSRD